jgi:predicted DNA-binding protein
VLLAALSDTHHGQGLPPLTGRAPDGLHRIPYLSDLCYPVGMGMKGITVKLPEAVAQQLRDQARQSGRSFAALIRERIEAPHRDSESVYAVSADLAGSVSGRRLPATNARARFRRA